MTPVEVDFMNNSILFSVFLVGVLIGSVLSYVVQTYLASLGRKYEDKE